MRSPFMRNGLFPGTRAYAFLETRKLTFSVSPLEGVGGRYYEDCAEAQVVERRGAIGTGGVAPYALDPANAERLWAVSEDLLATAV